MDGIESTRQIRRYEYESKLKRIPISALTANNTITDRNACMTAGMDAFISKPCTAQKLYECLFELEKLMDYKDI